MISLEQARKIRAVMEQVTYQGQRWVSIIDNNVWAPDVYGWEVVA